MSSIYDLDLSTIKWGFSVPIHLFLTAIGINPMNYERLRDIPELAKRTSSKVLFLTFVGIIYIYVMLWGVEAWSQNSGIIRLLTGYHFSTNPCPSIWLRIYTDFHAIFWSIFTAYVININTVQHMNVGFERNISPELWRGKIVTYTRRFFLCALGLLAPHAYFVGIFFLIIMNNIFSKVHTMDDNLRDIISKIIIPHSWLFTFVYKFFHNLVLDLSYQEGVNDGNPEIPNVIEPNLNQAHTD